MLGFRLIGWPFAGQVSPISHNTEDVSEIFSVAGGGFEDDDLTFNIDSVDADIEEVITGQVSPVSHSTEDVSEILSVAGDDFEDDDLTFNIDSVDADIGGILTDNSISASVKTRSNSTRYSSPVLPLNSQLKNHIQNSGPGATLSFLAEHTNSHNRLNVFELAFAYIKEWLKCHGSQKVVINKNCVHCTQAVEDTLRSILKSQKEKSAGSNTDSECVLFQVENVNEGDFFLLSDENGNGEIDLNSIRERQEAHINLSSTDKLAQVLTTAAPLGKRAMISVPVKGVGCRHAMNLIRSASGEVFVICGQSGKVYDLRNEGDIRRFNNAYGYSDVVGYPNFYHIFVSGDAPVLGKEESNIADMPDTGVDSSIGEIAKFEFNEAYFVVDNPDTHIDDNKVELSAYEIYENYLLRA